MARQPSGTKYLQCWWDTPAYIDVGTGTGLDAQLRDLKALGCERIFSEQVSSIGKRVVLGRVDGSSRGEARVDSQIG